MRIPVWMLALAAAAMVGGGVGCSGGGDDDDDDDDDGGTGLQTGTYVMSNAAYSGTDECDLINSWGIDVSTYDGAEYVVTNVTATEVTFEGGNGPVPLPRSGDTIGGDAQLAFQVDWSNTADTGLANPYNCVEEDYVTYTFTITSETSMDYNEFWTLTSTAGSANDCIVANSSAYAAAITAWPCESTITADLSI